MKARYLKHLLGDTGYIIHDCDEYIAVGSPLCHDLITVDKGTLLVKYALDTFKQGREAIRSKELEAIWDKLHELIKSGEIKEIIQENDVIDNPIPVYESRDGEVFSHVTDKIEWPNTTHTGRLIYNNTFFATRKEAVEYSMRECGYAIKMFSDNLVEQLKKVEEIRDEIKVYKDKLEFLNQMQLIAEG